jgi:hypothetical protein
VESYSGAVVLREEFDEDWPREEMKALDILGPTGNITNP